MCFASFQVFDGILKLYIGQMRSEREEICDL